MLREGTFTDNVVEEKKGFEFLQDRLLRLLRKNRKYKNNYKKYKKNRA